MNDLDRTAWFALVALAVVDIATTWYLLSLGGTEANPIARAAIAIDPVMLVPIKTGVLLTLWMLSRVRPRHEQIACVLTALSIHVAVVANNLSYLI